MGDKPGKKPKAKPPKLPGKPPPKNDKAATDKYNALVDFVDCKGNTVSLQPGKLDWLGLDLAPDATFEEDKTKPGTVNIKVDLGLGKITLPASVKDGKLDVDTSGLPMGAERVKKFVDDLNAWFEAKGKQLDGPTVKAGAITLTKSAVAAPGKAGEKKDDKGVKGGLLPHVPNWEKVGAGGLLVLAVLFGIGFMNAGDETETRTETVCPEPGGPGESARAGIDCPDPGADVDESVPPEGLAQLVRVVSITPEGGDSESGTVEPSNEQNKIFLELPLFMIGERDTVELLDKRNETLDTFSFTVPAKQGLAPPVTTERGGTVMCLIDHDNPIPPGRSGADCQYTEPVVDATPQQTPNGDGDTVEPVTGTVEEQTDGKPWSLLAIPGAALGLAGGLALDEERRRRKEGWSVGAGVESGGGSGETYPDWSNGGDEGPQDEGGFDPTTGTYPDWETNVPEPEAPAPPSAPRPDVM